MSIEVDLTNESTGDSSVDSTTTNNETVGEKLSRSQRAALKHALKEQSTNTVDDSSDGPGIGGKTIPDDSIADKIRDAFSSGSSKEEKKQGNTSQSNKGKKFNAKERIKEATEVAPFIDQGLAMYAGMFRHVMIDPSKMIVPYWYEKTPSGGVQFVTGTYGQAFAFFTLGSASATVDNIMAFIDKYREWFMLAFGVGVLAHFDSVCVAQAENLRNASNETARGPSVDVPYTPPPATEPVRIVLNNDSPNRGDVTDG